MLMQAIVGIEAFFNDLGDNVKSGGIAPARQRNVHFCGFYERVLVLTKTSFNCRKGRWIDYTKHSYWCELEI